jgi:hypothetical protein
LVLCGKDTHSRNTGLRQTRERRILAEMWSLIAFLFFQQFVDFFAQLVVAFRHLPSSFATKGAIKEAAPNNHGEEGNAIVKKEENFKY